MKKEETNQRSWRACFLLLHSAFCILTFSFFLSCASAQERPTDYQVKAVFLEKFGKFVEWPPSAFADETNENGGLKMEDGQTSSIPSSPPPPFVIGVFGEDPFHKALETVASRDTIKGHPVHVLQIKSLPDLKSCHIIFIPASEKSRAQDILGAIKGMPILTVGETDDFYAAGGMIEFVIEDRQVHFRINNDAARDAGLKISSKLLTLAKP